MKLGLGTLPLRQSSFVGRAGRAAGFISLALVALMLAGLPLLFAAVLTGGLLFAVIALLAPEVGLLLAILSVPVQDLVGLPADLTVTQLVVVAAAGSWMLRALAYPARRLGLQWQWPWFTLLGWQLLTVLMTPYSLGLGLQQWARWIAAWLAFTLTLGTLGFPAARNRQWYWLLAILLLGPLIAAIIGILQFVTASGPPSFLILGGRFARAAATFGKPNPFAGYLNMAWPLAGAVALWCLGAARRPEGWDLHKLWWAIVLGGATGVLLLGLFASYSRGGWIGAVCGLLGMALLAGRRSAAWTLASLVLALLVGLLGVFNVLPPVVTERLAGITNNLRIFDAARVTVTPENFAVVERMAHWQAGWRMWQAAPLVGIGPGNYNLAYLDFFVGRWSESQGHAHNYYIHALAESGLPGLLVYALLFGSMLMQGLRLRRIGRNSIWGAVGLGGCGIMLAVLGHNVFENLHVLNLGLQLSGVWALMIIGLQQVKRP